MMVKMRSKLGLLIRMYLVLMSDSRFVVYILETLTEFSRYAAVDRHSFD